MATYKTAEEARKNNIAKMGEPLGSLFSGLWQELDCLYCIWKEYEQLFGTKPARVDLLNKAAPLFFRIVQDLLWENTLLHLARLTDHPKSAGKPNLTIRRIPKLVKDHKLINHVSTLTDDAIKASEFCRDWRNRLIAHRDLSLALQQQGAVPLPPASRQKVTEALTLITKVLGAVELHYHNSTTTFDTGVEQGGARSLLDVVDDGLKAKVQLREKIHRGEVDSSDFHPRDI